MKFSCLLKPGFCLAILFSVALCMAYGQRTPFEGANTVYITANLADGQAYEAIEKVLSEQGVLFSAASDGILISAQNKRFGPYKGATFSGQLGVVGKLVKLTGTMQIPAADGSTETNMTVIPVAYQPAKRKESIQRLGFLYLNELAKKLQPALHGVVTYKLQG
jgi:hypothetical protein